MTHCSRIALAEKLMAVLLGRSVFSDAPNGLFLVAPAIPVKPLSVG